MKVKDMLRIAHSINDKVYTTSPHTNITSISKTLKEKGVGALPVVSDGILVGIVSERDIACKVVAEDMKPLYTLVCDVMTPNPTFVSLEENLEDCLDLMETGKFRHLPVLDQQKLVGMISIRDILIALLKEKDDLTSHYERYFIANR